MEKDTYLNSWKVLRKQTYKNIKVYIHDDGSSDKTLDIIKEYVEHKRGTIEFELFSKKSLRYPMCFINTLLEIPKADYYAFCDQTMSGMKIK